jgi:hypothetical protein
VLNEDRVPYGAVKATVDIASELKNTFRSSLKAKNNILT